MLEEDLVIEEWIYIAISSKGGSQMAPEIPLTLINWKYLFLFETQALNDNSISGSKPSFFTREHEAIGQSSSNISRLAKKYIYFWGCESLRYLI